MDLCDLRTLNGNRQTYSRLRSLREIDLGPNFQDSIGGSSRPNPRTPAMPVTTSGQLYTVPRRTEYVRNSTVRSLHMATHGCAWLHMACRGSWLRNCMFQCMLLQNSGGWHAVVWREGHSNAENRQRRGDTQLSWGQRNNVFSKTMWIIAARGLLIAGCPRSQNLSGHQSWACCRGKRRSIRFLSLAGTVILPRPARSLGRR